MFFSLRQENGPYSLTRLEFCLKRENGDVTRIGGYLPLEFFEHTFIVTQELFHVN